MSLEVMRTYKRLSKVFENSKVIPYDYSSKFVIMSDCHRGSGNSGDNFLKNQYIFFAALNDYYKKGFTYIGKIDLWNKLLKYTVVHLNYYLNFMSQTECI